jgi:energy-converting hydrogenase Eha subunit F
MSKAKVRELEIKEKHPIFFYDPRISPLLPPQLVEDTWPQKEMILEWLTKKLIERDSWLYDRVQSYTEIKKFIESL